ncbi:50S ribosomal protein L25 [candidate division WOR-3 bacterium]|nr:50S ribosomal protein L25 [candidate division WOR-3 bacterium]
MKIELPATTFETEKKGDVKRLRRQGNIPAVLYGHKEKTKKLYVEQRAFKKVLDVMKKETVIVNLEIGSKSYPCVIKALQHNPLTDTIAHIDFQHIHKKEKIRATVPIHTVGEAPGIEKGGILDVHLHEVRVRCLPDALPSHIDVDISNLDLGSAIHLRDLTVPDVDFELSADTTIVSVLVPRALEVGVKPAAAEEAVAAEEGAAEAGEGEGAAKEDKDKKEAKDDKKAKETPKGGK